MAKKSRGKQENGSDFKAKSGPQDQASAPPKRTTPSKGPQVPVIGMGASAGGLDALKEFFDALPDAPGAAFVVIQHLDPTKDSLFAELLDKHTKMKVTQVDDEPHVAANRVYVIPPGKYLRISGGKLLLSEPDRPRGTRTAIDYFLRSLAEDQNHRAVAIIFSGTGTDGSLGVKAIKAHGGMVIAQEPNSAAHDGMPNSAIATGAVDHVLPPKQMPSVLIRYAEHSYVHEPAEDGDDTPPLEVDKPAHRETKEQPNGMRGILSLLRARTPHDFYNYKDNTLIRRTRRRMCLLHLEEFSDYLDYLRKHAKEVDALVKDLLITVTDFFRDGEAWQALEERVLPQLIDNKEEDEPIRIWLPGCATGEEPYSMAILVLEQMQRARKVGPLNIFATDVDKDALDFARHGCYPASIEADVSRERLQQFFTRTDGSNYFRVSKALREAVVFAEQNLITDPPFSKLDLICCRNVLIYLKPEIQEKIVAMFHFALAPGGYLFLGNSETVGRHHDLFQTVDKRWRIFRRIGATRHDRLAFPVQISAAARRNVDRVTTAMQRDDMRMSHLAQHHLLDWLSPSAILVDANWHILYICGDVDAYLTHASGMPNDNVLEKCRRGLRSKLRGAIHKAIHEKQAVAFVARVDRDGGFQHVEVAVRPVHPRDGGADLALVVFGADQVAGTNSPERESAGSTSTRGTATSGRSKKAGAPAASPESDIDGEAVIRQLEDELAATQEDLRTTIEQLETSNEEFKAANEEVMSMNEELQSTNEELETSKEELQSLNEELITANNQLSVKVDELEANHADLRNLLAATDVATICLDTDLRIRWFTPAAPKVIRLTDTDLGRPLSDFAHDFVNDNLVEVAKDVLKKLSPVEAEVYCEDDRCYLRRVTPYRSDGHRIGGLVITFVDITERKKSERALERSEQMLRLVIDGLPAVVTYIDRTARYRFFNQRLCEWFHLDPEFVQGRSVREIMGDAAYEAARPQIEEALAGQPIHYEIDMPYRYGGPRQVEVTYTPDILEDGTVNGYVGLIQDITERKKTEAQLKALNESLEEQVALRVQTLSLLQDIAIAANEAQTLEEAVVGTLRRLCTANDWGVGHAWLPAEGEGRQMDFVSSGLWYIRSQPQNAARPINEFQRLTAETRIPSDQGIAGSDVSSLQPIWLEDIREFADWRRGDLTQFGLRSAIIFPVAIRGELMAVVELFADRTAKRDERLMEFMPAIGAQLAHVMERKRLEREIAEATSEQQRRLGRELHDSVSQELSGIGMIAQSLRQTLQEQSLPEAQRMGELVKHLQGAQDQIRRLSRGLLPVEVDADGLRAALEELAENCREMHSVHCEFHCSQRVSIESNDIATHLYRIAQEALQNAAKHGRPKRIDITLLDEDGVIILTIRDDGGGFTEEEEEEEEFTIHRGSGHRIMQYRANLIGADLQIESRKAEGVIVTCRMPRKSQP